MRKPTIWVPTRSDTNRPVQSQKLVRGWKFWTYKVEELYYPCSENKGADQLRSNCEADLRLCFRLCRLLVFPRGGSYMIIYSFHQYVCRNERMAKLIIACVNRSTSVNGHFIFSAVIIFFLAHQIEKSYVLPHVRNSYITLVISPRSHPAFKCSFLTLVV